MPITCHCSWRQPTCLPARAPKRSIDDLGWGHAECRGGHLWHRRRRRRRLSKPAGDISISATADYTDNTATSAAARCFPEPNPLAVALCERARPPVWVFSVDLMLDELAVSLVVSRPTGAPTSGCPSTPAIASQEVQTSLVNTRWDPMVLELDPLPRPSVPHRQLVALEGATLAMLRRPREAILREHPAGSLFSGGANVRGGRDTGLARPGRRGPGRNGGACSTDQASTTTFLPFRALVCVPLDSPVLKVPPRLCKSKTPTLWLPRRSARLAKKSKSRAANPTVQAHNVMMRRLGLLITQQQLDQEAVDAFERVFAEPISQSKHDTLESLLSTDLLNVEVFADKV